jgi:hypothetical protein
LRKPSERLSLGPNGIFSSRTCELGWIESKINSTREEEGKMRPLALFVGEDDSLAFVQIDDEKDEIFLSVRGERLAGAALQSADIVIPRAHFGRLLIDIGEKFNA